MIEDHLCEECNIDYEYLEAATEGGDAYVMVFPSTISFSALIAALNRLDAAEVERVFRLNNPSRSQQR